MEKFKWDKGLLQKYYDEWRAEEDLEIIKDPRQDMGDILLVTQEVPINIAYKVIQDRGLELDEEEWKKTFYDIYSFWEDFEMEFQVDYYNRVGGERPYRYFQSHLYNYYDIPDKNWTKDKLSERLKYLKKVLEEYEIMVVRPEYQRDLDSTLSDIKSRIEETNRCLDILYQKSLEF